MCHYRTRELLLKYDVTMAMVAYLYARHKLRSTPKKICKNQTKLGCAISSVDYQRRAQNRTLVPVLDHVPRTVLYNVRPGSGSIFMCCRNTLLTVAQDDL